MFVDQTGELGGAELCLADLAVHLRQRCSVLLFQEGPFQQLLESAGVSTIVLTGGAPKIRKNSSPLAYFLALPAFISLLRQVVRAGRRFDLLYANTPKAAVITAVAGLVSRKPFLIHLHDIIDAAHFSRYNRWLLVLATRFSSGIIANSQATADSFQKAGGRNRNLKVVPNGFCIQRFYSEKPEQRVEGSCPRDLIRKMRPQDPIPADRRAQVSHADREDTIPPVEDDSGRLTSEKPLIGMFGRITPWKGQKILVQALPRLPNVMAVIVGDALFTEEDRRYKQELVELAERLGVANRVQFTGFQREILPFLRKADMVVHCSVSPEPFGRVIVEAMLAGKPVIAARSGAPVEIIEDGVTGLLVTPGDAEELVQAIERLLNNRGWAEALANRGRQLAAQRYALDAVLREWVGFIDQIERSLPGSRRQTSCDWAAKSTVTGA